MKQNFGFVTGLRPGAWVLALALAGCGGGGTAGNTGGTASSRTPQEEIAWLEASGELPVLEREPTLGGIDANDNGVRDDIERYIEKKYVEPAQRKAAMQTARAYQQMLLVDKSDAVALENVSGTGFRAIVCLNRIFSGNDVANSSLVRTDIKAITTNTKQRLLAYLAYNKAHDGSVSRLPEGETCE